MPWKSYSHREEAKRIIKDAAAEGKLGTGNTFDYGERPEQMRPVCSLGHLYGIKGVPNMLTGEEAFWIIQANDRSPPFERAEAVCRVFDQIPVGVEE